MTKTVPARHYPPQPLECKSSGNRMTPYDVDRELQPSVKCSDSLQLTCHVLKDLTVAIAALQLGLTALETLAQMRTTLSSPINHLWSESGRPLNAAPVPLSLLEKGSDLAQSASSIGPLPWLSIQACRLCRQMHEIELILVKALDCRNACVASAAAECQSQLLCHVS